MVRLMLLIKWNIMLHLYWHGYINDRKSGELHEYIPRRGNYIREVCSSAEETIATIAKNAMNIRTACFEVWIAVATAYEEMSTVRLLIHVLRPPKFISSSLFSAITVNLTKHDRRR